MVEEAADAHRNSTKGAAFCETASGKDRFADRALHHETSLHAVDKTAPRA